MTVIIAAVFSSSGRYGEKSADQEALEEQKSRSSGKFTGDRQKLADEQKKWTISRAASKNAPSSGRW